MNVQVNRSHVTIDDTTLRVKEVYAVAVSYDITQQDVNYRDAVLNQLENLVKQFNTEKA